jgi:hypothetical protein
VLYKKHVRNSVVAVVQSGVELAQKIRQQDDKSYSSFLMKKLGGIMMGSSTAATSSKQIPTIISHSHGAIPRTAVMQTVIIRQLASTPQHLPPLRFQP